MWQNIVKPGRPPMTIWQVRIACRIPKATNTPSEYVMIIAFPLQQWLHERTSVLRYSTLSALSHTFIKTRRIVWVAYVARMVEMNVQFW